VKDPLDYSLRRFMDALDRLREGATEARDELDRDGVIQRFEFCFELLMTGSSQVSTAAAKASSR
jgi:hypothetical protein